MTSIQDPIAEANRRYYETMPTRRVTIRVEVEADVEWRENDPDYCEQVARLETAWEDGGRSKNRTARVLSVVVEHPVVDSLPVEKARKKPVTVNVHTWDGDWDALMAWVDSLGYEEGDGDDRDAMWVDGDSLVIPTLEGDMRGALGDVIICGVNGEFYPCKPDIFEVTYEMVS